MVRTPVLIRVLVGLLAAGAFLFALARLLVADLWLERREMVVDGTPVTVTSLAGVPPGPAIVIAHGFAGSRPLMQPLAATLARAGYVAVTYDLAGHGRNPAPLTGSITDIDGATMTLVREAGRVTEVARRLGDGRLAIAGHSMVADIVVRLAQATPDIAAVVALSMFSPAVTDTVPRNLLVVVGDFEPGLKAEALRAVGLATAPKPAAPGVAYGLFADGTARRAVFARGVEHVTILYSADMMDEAVAWLDRSFGIARALSPEADRRGPWIALLIAAALALALLLAPLLPRASAEPQGAGLSWRQLWPLIVVPAVVTPFVLLVAPTHFLPVLVADYLAAHFLTFGLIVTLMLWWRGERLPGLAPVRALVAAALAVVFVVLTLFLPLDRWFTSFVPSGQRLLLFAVLFVGMAAFFVPVEWMTRGAGHARGGYAAIKAAFVASLFVAVALDFERLMFLAIIVPFVILFFIVFGLMSDRINRATGHPLAGALFNAAVFAWALAVTFPLIAG
jgi:pimeloyl-ACP methyl ester carboxylesterase